MPSFQDVWKKKICFIVFRAVFLTGSTSDHGVETPAIISKVDILHEYMSVSKEDEITF